MVNVKIIKTRKLYTACISPKSNTSRTNSFTYMIDDDQCSLFEDAHQCHLQDSYGSCNDTLSEPRYLQAPTRCTQVTRQQPSSATAGFHSETVGTEQECVRSFCPSPARNGAFLWNAVADCTGLTCTRNTYAFNLQVVCSDGPPSCLTWGWLIDFC